MAEDILQRARNALNRSQQFRTPSLQLEPRIGLGPNDSNQQKFRKGRHPHDEPAVNFLKPEALRKSIYEGESVKPQASEVRSGLSNLPTNPTKSNLKSIQKPKSNYEDSTMSSVTMTSEQNSRNRPVTGSSRIQKSTEELSISKEKNDESEITVKTESFSHQSKFLKTEITLSEPSSIISPVRTQSSRRSTTPKIKVRSLVSSISEENSAHRISPEKSQSLATEPRIKSLTEISEHLEAPEIQPNQTKIQFEINHETKESEDTLSYVSSIKTTSEPETEDENEANSSHQIESQMNSVVAKISSLAISVPPTNARQIFNNIMPCDNGSAENDISERIESIIKDLASVQESLQTQTYTPSFISEGSTKKSVRVVADSSEKYDSSFIEEQQESYIPLRDKILASTKFQKLVGKSALPRKLSAHRSQDKQQVKPPILTSEIPTKPKSKKRQKQEPTKSGGKVSFEKIQAENEYSRPKLRHKIKSDFSHQVILNASNDLPAFCSDLIRNVVDSNERMYLYTMEAAENMSRMYHRKKRET